MSDDQTAQVLIKPQTASKPMLVTDKEAQMILRLRKLNNDRQAEARVKLPEMKVEPGG